MAATAEGGDTPVICDLKTAWKDWLPTISRDGETGMSRGFEPPYGFVPHRSVGSRQNAARRSIHRPQLCPLSRSLPDRIERWRHCAFVTICSGKSPSRDPQKRAFDHATASPQPKWSRAHAAFVTICSGKSPIWVCDQPSASSLFNEQKKTVAPPDAVAETVVHERHYT
jgi:hypothetical protein